MKGRVELPSGCGGPVSFGRGYVVIRADGQLLAGFGYGGPGRPVAYWSDRKQDARIYRTAGGAAAAAERVGGSVRMVRLDYYGRMERASETEDAPKSPPRIPPKIGWG